MLELRERNMKKKWVVDQLKNGIKEAVIEVGEVAQIQGTRMLCHSLAFQVERIISWKRVHYLTPILIHIHNITGILIILQDIILLKWPVTIRHQVLLVCLDHIQRIQAIRTISIIQVCLMATMEVMTLLSGVMANGVDSSCRVIQMMIRWQCTKVEKLTRKLSVHSYGK